jgi:DnaJ-like protein
MNVHFTYDAASGGYALKMTGMSNRFDWDKLKLFTGALKGLISASDRDYDPILKTWFIAPKHFQTIKVLINCQFSDREIFIVEAPEGAGAVPITFHSSEDDLRKLCELLYVDIKLAKEWTYDEAKKRYRKAAMQYHPDRNGGDGSKMSSLNEVWTRLSNSTSRDFWKDYIPVKEPASV